MQLVLRLRRATKYPSAEQFNTRGLYVTSLDEGNDCLPLENWAASDMEVTSPAEAQAVAALLVAAKRGQGAEFQREQPFAWRLTQRVLARCGATPVLAVNSWRCGSRLVGRGNGIEEVYTLCGEPTDSTATTEFVTVKVSYDVSVTRAVQVEEWTYNRGPKQFVRLLTFWDGTLVGIEEGGYGY